MNPSTQQRSQQLRLLRSIRFPSIPGTRPGTLKSVLKLIDEYSNLRDGVCWASQETMASDLGISVATVRRSLKALEKLRVLAWERRKFSGRMSRSHYTIVWDKLAQFRRDDARRTTVQQSTFVNGDEDDDRSSRAEATAHDNAQIKSKSKRKEKREKRKEKRENYYCCSGG